MTLQTNCLASLRLVVCCWLVVCYSGSFVSASTQPEKRYFDVPSGPAINTLKEAARQADVEFLFPAAFVAGVETPRLRGRYTTSEAFNLLLAGTSLFVSQHEESGIYTLREDAQEAVSDTNLDKANNMNNKNKVFGTVKKGVWALLLLPAAYGQDNESEQEVFELSPFVVDGSTDTGYRANETLAGTRFNSQLKDLPSQINVLTKDFLDDIAAIDVNDAFLYSANIENSSEFLSVADGQFMNDLMNISGTGASRIRGLSSPGSSRDFYRSVIPRDNYNIDRITVSSGPNSILFGNANPGGVVDTAFMRANAEREKREVAFRLDNYGTFRTSVDFNKPIIEDRLGIRLAAAHTNQKFYQDPAYKKDERLSISLVGKLSETTTVRGYYETMQFDSIHAYNTTVGDSVTPWIEAGRPAFDNSVPGATFDPAIFSRYTERNRPLYILNSNGEVPYMPWGHNNQNRFLTTEGPDAAYVGTTDAHSYSLPYGSDLFPSDINIAGNSNRREYEGEVYGASFSQKLPGGGYLELGYNREQAFSQVAQFLNGPWMTLRADANLYLPDANLYPVSGQPHNPTPNPNFGRYYVETTGTPRHTHGRAEEEALRAQVSYDLDFSEGDGVGKWLGRHRLAAMWQREEYGTSGQFSQARLYPASWTHEQLLDYFNTGNNAISPANSRQPYFRAYIDDPKTSGGQSYVWFPFNLLEGYNQVLGSYNGDDYVLWSGYGHPYGSHRFHSIVMDRLDSMVFATQSFFLKNRLVVSYGLRRDDASSAESFTELMSESSGAGSQFIQDIPLSDDYLDTGSGTTKTIGAVGHAFPWLSVFYNQSSTWNPLKQQTSLTTGERYQGNIGDGEDYGVMLRFLDNKLALRLNRYINVGGPDYSSYVNTLFQIRDIEQILDQAYEDGQLNGAPPIPASPYFDWDSNITAEYSVLSDQRSEGYELSLTYNPTKNWRITLNGSKADATQSNIGRDMIEFIRQRSQIWADNSHLHTVGNTNNTIQSEYLGIMSILNEMYQADGQAVESARSARANFFTRYSFEDGRYKGFFLGGGARYRAKSVVGYRSAMVDNVFASLPGAPAQLLTAALDSPVYGDETLDFDALFGYSRKIFDDVKWKIQLNVRNLLDDTDPVPQRINQAEGFISRYRIPEPRSFILTSSFEF